MDARINMPGMAGRECKLDHQWCEPVPAEHSGPCQSLTGANFPMGEGIGKRFGLHEIVEVAFPTGPAAECENSRRFVVGVQTNGIVTSYDLMVVILNEFMQLIGVLFPNAAFFDWNSQASLMDGIGIHIDREQEDVRFIGIHFPIEQNVVVVGLVKLQIGEGV